jgi:creatinine amidohydrolase/Fe(II)-dependent formamide hydrolase-like protein
MRSLIVAAFLSLSLSTPALAEVRLEDMTSPEIRDAIAAGKTIVIIPTGGTEQNGPHITLGKHNFTLEYTASAVATKLGNALVAPIIAYVPEGDITPPTGHMRFAGTLSLTPETFAAVLEDTARSLKQHGFKTICFVGEHGASQSVQKQVAEKLSAEWMDAHVKVLHINAYYDEHNGQSTYLSSVVKDDKDPQAHGGLADTSEMLFVHPKAVRETLRGAYTAADFEKLGVQGPSDKATAEIGKKLIELKVDAAVKQIKAESIIP